MASPSIDGPVDDVNELVADRDAVVFDMDGTLLVLAAPWKRLRRQLREFLEPEIVPTGPERPASETLRDLRAQGRQEDVDRVLARLREAEIAGVADSHPVPAGIGLLERVQARGLPVGVVSNNHQEAVEAALETHGLREGLDLVVGLGATEKLKPDPAGLLEAFDDLGVNPGSGLYVGDDWKDFEAGAAAGVPTVDVADLPPPDA